MLSDVDHKAVATALIRGQGSANHVKKMVENGSVPPEALVTTVVDSISLALSLIGPPVLKRSLTKRTSCGNERYKDDPSPVIEDGFSWRKYGSKTIKTSPHKRSYFRCTYSKDQNCNAKKRVQKLQDDPLVYRTTYEGHHTCEAPVFSHPTNDGSMMIRFDQLDQSIPESVPPEPVPTNQQITVGDIMNLEYESNDDQSWAYQLPLLSPTNFMSMDDISGFDYDLFQV